MRRKLITLLVALVALVGFNVSAAPVAVGILTGDSTTRADLTSEKGGYAGKVTELPNKLAVENGKFVFKAGLPNGASDKITVNNPAVNYITFTQGSTTLSLPYVVNGTTLATYSQFVVFTGRTTNQHVIDYNKTDQAAITADQNQIITPAAYNNGGFEGFLGIQAGGFTDDKNLLIVVHNDKGELSLVPYGDYVASIGTNLYAKAAAKQWYPLYIKTMVFTGRWATPADFADCKFMSFSGVDKNGVRRTLAAYNKGQTSGTTYSVFTVKQVDYVKNGDTEETHNIITHYSSTGDPANPTGASFQGKDGKTPIAAGDDHNTNNPNSEYFGTTGKDPQSTEAVDSVIPLFVLSTPDNGCQVLSVSRQNLLNTQSENDAGYANSLEVRGYGEYQKWNTTTGALTWEVVAPDAADNAFDVYTSLQKFAIWVTEDGEYILYPAATYFWKYGENKYLNQYGAGTGIGQPDNIHPNAVLLYNDINVKYESSLTVTSPADKQWGVQIGWWNGRNSKAPWVTSGYVGTIPNSLQTWTDYLQLKLKRNCETGTPIKEGRYFFLQVMNPDTVGFANSSDTYVKDAFGYNAAGRTGNYQYNREYVIATQVGKDGNKYLVLLPKEKVMADTVAAHNKDYWRFPYDSVNMAAHWEVKAVSGGGYRLINELGDTLKFNVPADGTIDNFLAGGYLPVNSLISGMHPDLSGSHPAIDDDNAGDYLFGSPLDTKGIWDDATALETWFDKNPTETGDDTKDIWNFFPYNNVFFIQLSGVENTTITLTPNLEPDGSSVRGWQKDADDLSPYAGEQIPEGTWGSGPDGRTYFQQYINLEATQNNQLVSIEGDVATCPGLMLSLTPIPYVPTYGPFYPGDKTTDTENRYINNNSNDLNYWKQDSLMAYTFLEGTYDLKEANAVENTLKLGYTTVSLNDGNSLHKVDQARLVVSQAENILQFIPVNSALGKVRNAAILASGATEADVDTLFNETYKWYLVKNTINGKYLTFDTVNVAAETNQLKVGMVFSADSLANATPVRLYQPLVGDKFNNNFLIQFYMPKYTYNYNTTSRVWSADENSFPDIESRDMSATVPGGGEVCFAKILNQSNYLFATRGYTGTGGTRLTIIAKPATPCPCVGDFVSPKWMAENRLLSLPLNNQIFVGTSAVSAWISTGNRAAGSELTTEGAANSAIVQNESATASTSLTHTYVTSIRVFNKVANGANENFYELGKAKVGIPATPGRTDYQSWIGGTASINATGNANVHTSAAGESFKTDLEVPLYYVQNEAGQYLTVVPISDMQDTRATEQDVNGVKLQWLDRPYQFNQVEFDSIGYDRRAFQLFAVSGCETEAVSGQFGNFVYLPLASYVVDYQKNRGANIVTVIDLKGKNQVKKISYNFNLGKVSVGNNGCPGNDITACYRISQYTAVDKTIKDLVVFNSNSAVGVGNLIPIEFRLSRQGYIKGSCDYQLVQNAGRGANAGKFYAYNTLIGAADENTLAAHWKISWSTGADTYMATFNPELQTIYNNPVVKSQLTGQYYFIKLLDGTLNTDGTVDFSKGATVRAIDVSQYNSDNFVAKYDTFRITCTGHDLPFFDLERNGGFDLSTRLAILESPFLDRNLGSVVNAADALPEFTEIWRNGRLVGYKAYINELAKGDLSGAEYLNVYREDRRQLTPNTAAGEETHVIPYYSFSVSKNGKEYFLNVNAAKTDSVEWDTITPQQRNLLMDPEGTGKNQLKLYKFCLPYKKNADGTNYQITYNGVTYNPVYLQTLDVDGVRDYPWLIIAGSATKYVTTRNLNDAMLSSTTVNGVTTGQSLDLNIYSVDYRYIHPEKVTSWVFDGSQANCNLWVPIAEVINQLNNTKEGAITDFKVNNGGTNFVAASGEQSPNFGIMTGSSNNVNLTLVFKGDTTIGDWAQRRIWYYQIMSNGKYLTDATNTTGNKFLFQGVNHNIAEFTDLLVGTPGQVAANNPGARFFDQTFGFRYVSCDTARNQEFYIVSNANYTNKTPESGYRYLANVQNHLIFVNDVKDAMVFQWGKVEGGNYTELQVVGQGGIFGVAGGVKFLNTTGKVDIYTIDGRLIKSAVLAGTETTIAAPRGIAVVKNGSKVVKVVVR